MRITPCGSDSLQTPTSRRPCNPGGTEKSTQSLRSKLGRFCRKKISLFLSKSRNLRKSSNTTPPLTTSWGQGSMDLFGTRRLLFFHHGNEILKRGSCDDAKLRISLGTLPLAVHHRAATRFSSMISCFSSLTSSSSSKRAR
jgi:hypothetical protein